MPTCSSCGFPTGKSASCLPIWWKSGFKRQRGRIPHGSTGSVLRSLRDVTAIQEMLHDYLWDSISVRDTAVRKNQKENFYHGMLLGLLRSQGNWLVKSNAEMGEGYSDITVQTPDRIGIVIELKYAEDGNLESSCKAALAQIEDRKYGEGLKRRGVKKLLQYGIAFYEKECLVVMA